MSTDTVRSALQQSFVEHVDAGFAGLFVQSFEQHEALSEMQSVAQQNGWGFATFDMDCGLTEHERSNNDLDPVAAIRWLKTQRASTDGAAVLVLVNGHRMLQDLQVIQVLTHAVIDGKLNRRFVVILGTSLTLPPELEKLFVVLEHSLPNREAMDDIMRHVATSEDVPEGEALDRLLAAAAGLTHYEAEGAFALSLVRNGGLNVETLWELKAGMLKKTGTLELHRGTENFGDLGGLDGLKKFCRNALTSGSGLRSKGVMLLGVPGSGKSAFAKALGNETGRPTVTLDFGALKGSLVGQSEERTRAALKAIDAMAPCVLFIDEIEKGLSGGNSSHDGDNGVSSGILGSFLTWLNDHTSDVFVICTANNIAKLPPEFSRAERFDGVFFFDLPSEEQRDAIWALYEEKFNLSASQVQGDINDNDWTGAEIKACCRLTKLLQVPLTEAAENIVPIAKTSAVVGSLREWAENKVLDANRGGIYRRPETQAVNGHAVGRRVVRLAK